MRAKILYVEDDPNLGFVTKDSLELNDYEIVHCTDGLKGWQAFEANHCDLCVLDVMLPELDGFSLAQRIRKADIHVPILFLTARSLQEDKLHGLRLGADDYLTKPFSIDELILKIEVFLRRNTQKTRNINHSVGSKVGIYLFDFQKLTLKNAPHSQTLTYREAEVLKYLTDRPNEVIKRNDMLKAIWGDDDYFMGRSLDVFISRLRKYLSADPSLKIESIHGVGFRFVSL
jgi:two-component system, OmpR family, response regulator VicR